MKLRAQAFFIRVERRLKYKDKFRVKKKVIQNIERLIKLLTTAKKTKVRNATRSNTLQRFIWKSEGNCIGMRQTSVFSVS